MVKTSLHSVIAACSLLLLSMCTYAQNVGIGTAVPNTGLDVVRDLALREAAAVTITANQINSGSSSHLRVTNTGTINRILNPQNGKVLYLINNSGGAIVLANNAAATANKIITGSGANYSLPAGATAHLIYNTTLGAWQLAGVSPSAGWLLTGNAGTNPAVNFVGTTDAQSLRFRVNNQFSGLIEHAANDGNTAFGYNAMDNLIASGALRNVAVGDGVLGALNPINPLDGDDNTGIGYRALYSNTTGRQNTATGAQALYSNTTGVNNTATGSQALYSNTTGYDNTATGARALYSNTTGYWNVATGARALYSNTIGVYNVATGFEALISNTTGSNNTATGLNVLGSNITGSNNTATGRNALRSNTTGWNNTATGGNALYSNTIGWNNTALGYNAGFTNAVGTNNTYLGFSADANAGSYDNSTAIGHAAVVRASNSMMFGDNAVTNWSFGRVTAPTAGRALEVGTAPTNGNGAYLTSGGNWTNTSDRNLKTNIINLSGAEILAKIGQLPITRWTYKGTNETHIGPMAQDFYRLFNVGLDSVSISTVDPSGVALIGIQELKRQVESLNAENDALKKEIGNLNKELENLRRENAEQQKENAGLKEDNTMLKELTTKLETEQANLKELNKKLQTEQANLKELNKKLQTEQANLKAVFEARLKLLEDRAGIKAEK